MEVGINAEGCKKCKITKRGEGNKHHFLFAQMALVSSSVNRVVEFPGAGLGRLITINSELNGAI